MISTLEKPKSMRIDKIEFLYGMPARRVRQLIKEKAFEAILDGKLYLVDIASFERYLNRRKLNKEAQ